MNYYDKNTYKNILNQLCSMSGIDLYKLNEKLSEDSEFASLFFVIMNRYKIDPLKFTDNLKLDEIKDPEVILKKSRKIRELYVHAVNEIEKAK